jgi:hypothetical protein
MLKDIVTDFVEGKRVVLTSSTNNGCSSFALYIANTILDNDRVVLYYNPSRDIDREFVGKYYPRVLQNAVWVESPLDSFLEFLQGLGYSYDCLIIDPGDVLLVNKNLVKTLGSLRRPGASIIFTSQIRQDPKQGWAPYSTIEKLNDFDYSIWITNVTGNHPIYKLKYIDIFKDIRSGNNFIARDIAKFTDEGNIIE